MKIIRPNVFKISRGKMVWMNEVHSSGTVSPNYLRRLLSYSAGSSGEPPTTLVVIAMDSQIDVVPAQHWTGGA